MGDCGGIDLREVRPSVLVRLALPRCALIRESRINFKLARKLARNTFGSSFADEGGETFGTDGVNLRRAGGRPLDGDGRAIFRVSDERAT